MGLYMKLPIIDEEGYLSKYYKRKPSTVPRLGESIYLLPKLYSKVEKVSYGGHDLEAVNLVLTPISATHVKELTTVTFNNPKVKQHTGWEYQNGISYEYYAGDPD
jgi:hypothetical protein